MFTVVNCYSQILLLLYSMDVNQNLANGREWLIKKGATIVKNRIY